MLRWMLGLTRLDRVMNMDIRKRLGVAPITEKMREAWLQWYGHVVHSSDDSVAKAALRLSPRGWRPRGRLKIRWLDRLKDDMKKRNIEPEDALNRAKWRRASRTADPASTRD